MRENLFKAKRKDNGEWIEGYIFKLKGKEKHLMFTGEFDKSGAFPKFVHHEIEPATICKCTGKEYMNGETAYEGDIYKNPKCGVVFVLKYGTYTAYCPEDNTYMDNVGFFAEAEGYPQMPIGDLSTYALKIGNIFDNTELFEKEK